LTSLSSSTPARVSEGQSVQVLGFGQTSEVNGAGTTLWPDTLQLVTLPFVSQRTCSSLYNTFVLECHASSLDNGTQHRVSEDTIFVEVEVDG